MPRTAAFLFWNLNKQHRGALVAELVQQENIDVVVLAENGMTQEDTVAALRQVDNAFYIPVSDTRRPEVYCRDPNFGLNEVYGDASNRVSVRVLNGFSSELLLVVAHLVDKRNWEAADQAIEFVEMSRQIRELEGRREHQRTIMLGDLNMNPFDLGVVAAACLHAKMTKRSVEEESRTVQRREYPFFYNPMWQFFGDATPGPAGTHYYRHSGHVSYDWNILDQVLIRPQALPWFGGDVKIVDRVGGTSLADSHGRPDSEIGSDHFPIVFRLQEPE